MSFLTFVLNLAKSCNFFQKIINEHNTSDGSKRIWVYYDSSFTKLKKNLIKNLKWLFISVYSLFYVFNSYSVDTTDLINRFGCLDVLSLQSDNIFNSFACNF